MGASATLATALLGLLKAWHYLEIDMPERVNNYLNACEIGLFEERDRLVFELERFHQNALAARGLPQSKQPRKPKLPQLENSKTVTGELVPGLATLLQQRIGNLSMHKSNAELELSSAYLLLGMQGAHEADLIADTDRTKVATLRREALLRFKEATRHVPHEYRASEHAINQAIHLRDLDDAKQIALLWQNAAVPRADALPYVKSRRYAARVEWERSNDPSLTLAQRSQLLASSRDTLQSARLDLESNSSINPHDKGLELGHICELLAQIRIANGTYPSANNELRRARRYFAQHGTPDDVNRIDRLLSGLPQNPPRPPKPSQSRDPNRKLRRRPLRR